MKTLLIIAGVLIAGGGIIAWQLSVNTNPVEINREYIYLGDQTEEDFPLIHVKDLTALSVSLDGKTNQGEIFRVVPITELSINPVQQLTLPAVPNKLLGNELKRKEEVEKYRKELTTALNKAGEGRQSRKGSVIFQVIARELTRLTRSQAIHRTLIVNSDLMELSRLTNFYDTETFWKLQSDPDTLIQQFTDRYSIPDDLTGITVHFVFQPKDRQENHRFEVVSGVYRQQLESRGATVIVSGNLVSDQ